MKLYYVTYKLNEQARKAELNEKGYVELQNNPSVSELIVYPTKLIMENNYQRIACDDGSCSNRQILRG